MQVCAHVKRSAPEFGILYYYEEWHVEGNGGLAAHSYMHMNQAQKKDKNLHATHFRLGKRLYIFQYYAHNCNANAKTRFLMPS